MSERRAMPEPPPHQQKCHVAPPRSATRDKNEADEPERQTKSRRPLGPPVADRNDDRRRLPAVVVCGESGAGKTTFAAAVESRFGFLRVEGDLVHDSPPWNDYGIMEELCVRFVTDDVFMRRTVDTIVTGVVDRLLGETTTAAGRQVPVRGLVVPFVMYTRRSREYMRLALPAALPRLLLSPDDVLFVWLSVDEAVQRVRNVARDGAWARLGVGVRPNELYDRMRPLYDPDDTGDCLVVKNNVDDDLEAGLEAVRDSCGLPAALRNVAPTPSCGSVRILFGSTCRSIATKWRGKSVLTTAAGPPRQTPAMKVEKLSRRQSLDNEVSPPALTDFSAAKCYRPQEQPRPEGS